MNSLDRKASPNTDLLLRLARAESADAMHGYHLAEAQFSQGSRSVAIARARAEEALVFEQWAESLQPMQIAA